LQKGLFFSFFKAVVEKEEKVSADAQRHVNLVVGN
jgi:hypothetical protein